MKDSLDVFFKNVYKKEAGELMRDSVVKQLGYVYNVPHCPEDAFNQLKKLWKKLALNDKFKWVLGKPKKKNIVK